PDRQRLDAGGQLRGIQQLPTLQTFMQQSDLQAIQTGALAQYARQGLALARSGEQLGERCRTAVRGQIQLQGGLPVTLQYFPQGRGQGIDEAAFQTILGDDAFAAALQLLAAGGAQTGNHRLERLPGEPAAQVLAPVAEKATVGRPQIPDVHALLTQQ